MKRWLASRWMVMGAAVTLAALVLSWHLSDPTPFIAVAPVYLGGGQVNNGLDKWRDVRREQIGHEGQ